MKITAYFDGLKSEKTRRMLEYTLNFLEKRNIKVTKIIKDEDDELGVFVKDEVYTPDLGREIWRKIQEEFNVDFPCVLVDSDLFCWSSCKTQDLSKYFLELEVDVDIKPIDKIAKLSTIEEISSSINHLSSTENKKTNASRTNDSDSFRWSCETQDFSKLEVNSKLLTETTKIETSNKKSRGYIQAQNDQSDYSKSQLVA